jgi:tryptophanyl-tRNA synthetase
MNHQDIVLTGDRPSGHLHLGHYVGSLKTRLEFQKTHPQFVMIADLQALTDHFDAPDHVHQASIQLVLDYLAVGIDPNKTTIFLQSQIPELTELSFYYMNLVTVARLERNPTVKHEIQQKGFDQSLPVGFFCYPISQAADITAFKAKYVPVGQDQLPMIEQTNEIVRRFNRIYQCDLLVECEAKLSHAPKLIGIDGQHKASKSLGNAIFLSDEPDVIQEKVNQMYTDPNHLRVCDPGLVEGNVVFSYLDAFYPDPAQIQIWKTRYEQGGLGDRALKNHLNDCLQSFLLPIREKRKEITIEDAQCILKAGSQKAREVASKTLSQVRQALGLNWLKK